MSDRDREWLVAHNARRKKHHGEFGRSYVPYLAHQRAVMSTVDVRLTVGAAAAAWHNRWRCGDVQKLCSRGSRLTRSNDPGGVHGAFGWRGLSS